MGAQQLALITGGSRGIGRFLVQSFLGHSDVLSVSRTPAPLGAGARHTLHELSIDLTATAKVGPSLTAWLDQHPEYEITTLIHNAAVSPLGWLHELPGAEVEQAFQVNVFAPLAITSAVLRAGRFAAGGARVVYVTSSLARPLPELSFASLGLYSTTKAALSRMALVQAREFELIAPHVSVLRAHPGIVDTDMQRDLRRHPGMDPAFAVKTAGLPPYQEGDWRDRSPSSLMRTVSPEFSAEFLAWVARSAPATSSEYDFYQADEFHTARQASGAA